MQARDEPIREIDLNAVELRRRSPDEDDTAAQVAHGTGRHATEVAPWPCLDPLRPGAIGQEAGDQQHGGETDGERAPPAPAPLARFQVSSLPVQDRAA